MALPASSLCPLTHKFPIKLFNSQQCLQHRCSSLYECYPIRPSFSMKVRMSWNSEPVKFKLQASVVKDRLLEAFPDSVKDFPWRKAGNVLLERMLSVGQKALKWSVIVFSILDFIVTVIYSISRNQELLIPVGLLSGCLLADLCKEVSHAMFQDAKEEGMKWVILGLTSFFVVISLSSTYFGLRTRVFLSLIAHGGLLQVWWMWRNTWNLKSEDSTGWDPSSISQES